MRMRRLSLQGEVSVSHVSAKSRESPVAAADLRHPRTCDTGQDMQLRHKKMRDVPQGYIINVAKWSGPRMLQYKSTG